MRLGKLLATLLMLRAVCPASAQTSSSDQAMAKYIAAQAAAGTQLPPGDQNRQRFAESAARVAPNLPRHDGPLAAAGENAPERHHHRRLQRPGYSVENLHFQSSPHLYVTGNLYLPNPLPKEKLPTILYLCGHYTNMGQNGNKTHPDCQSHAIWFATHGYVVLVLDTLELGEIAGLHRGQLGRGKTPPADLRWWWYSAGYTSAGVELWNSIRGLDYLVSRPEVDVERLGVTASPAAASARSGSRRRTSGSRRRLPSAACPTCSFMRANWGLRSTATASSFRTSPAGTGSTFAC